MHCIVRFHFDLCSDRRDTRSNSRIVWLSRICPPCSCSKQARHSGRTAQHHTEGTVEIGRFQRRCPRRIDCNWAVRGCPCISREGIWSNWSCLDLPGKAPARMGCNPSWHLWYSCTCRRCTDKRHRRHRTDRETDIDKPNRKGRKVVRNEKPKDTKERFENASQASNGGYRLAFTASIRRRHRTEGTVGAVRGTSCWLVVPSRAIQTGKGMAFVLVSAGQTVRARARALPGGVRSGLAVRAIGGAGGRVAALVAKQAGGCIYGRHVITGRAFGAGGGARVRCVVALFASGTVEAPISRLFISCITRRAFLRTS